MKRSCLLMTLILFMFASCGKQGTEPNVKPVNGGSTEQQIPLTGVWESGNYFVSFSADGLCTAYLSPKFIDCGDYTRKAKEISCLSKNFSRTTTYTIQSISDTNLSVTVSYKDVQGTNQSSTLNLKKSSKSPTSKDHLLLGKAYKQLTTFAGTVTYSFSTYYSGTRLASSGAAKRYGQTIFYIFLDNKVYMQYFDIPSADGNAIPSIGGWNIDNNDGTVHIYNVTFGPSGNINIMSQD